MSTDGVVCDVPHIESMTEIVRLARAFALAVEEHNYYSDQARSACQALKTAVLYPADECGRGE